MEKTGPWAGVTHGHSGGRAVPSLFD